MKKVSAKKAYALECILLLILVWCVTAVIFKWLKNSSSVFFVAVLCSAVIVLFYTSYTAQKYFRVIVHYCYQYRWVLALVVFIVCVALRIHGSSIGAYNKIFPTQTKMAETTLFGIPRSIRSDEYGVQTPVFFSQTYNDYKLYSEQMSLSETNMVLDYYSPVKDIVAIGKPFLWGYLLFGNEIGLSWYWCGTIILLFMTAFEMCLILTQRARLASFLGAVMIVLSPEIQWWVLPHMPIVILYSMSLFCVIYSCFTVKNAVRRRLLMGLGCTVALGFALSIFPSYQVPCAYVILALLIASLYRDREFICFTKNDCIWLLISVLTVVGILIRFYIISVDDFDLLLNTAYPGHRVSTGGTWKISSLFTDLSSFFLPYKDITYANNCEVSTYIHLAPFFLGAFPQMSLCLRTHEDKNYLVGKTLMIILVIQAVFMVIGFPRFIAEVTLLRFCNRMDGVYGWVATLFTVWGMAVFMKYPDLFTRREKFFYPFIFGVFNSFLVDDKLMDYFSRFMIHGTVRIGWLLVASSVAALMLVLYCILYCKRRMLAGLVVLMMLFSGGTVNPIEKGIGAVINHPLSNVISSISNSQADALWLCTDCSFFISNYVMANGARVLDATNFYPDIEKWTVLDPEQNYDEITNRYANMSATLTNEETSIELMQADHIRLLLNPKSIKEMEVEYLFSKEDYSDLLLQYHIGSEIIAQQDGYGIYKLLY